MKKRIYIIIFLYCIVFALHAQSWDFIKTDVEYVWGEGWGASLNEADQQALTDMISKISVTVSSDFESATDEFVSAGQATGGTKVNILLQTYSSATLTNTQRLVLQNEPNAHVGRFVKVSEIQKIFESRKMRVKDMVGDALRAERLGKVDDALRYYYWAWLLLHSLQHPNQVKYMWEEDGREHVLTNWIPDRIDDIIDDLKAEVVKRDGDDVELFITYNGKPVSSIDYNFYDGRDWVGPYSAKDGRGVLELAPGFEANAYKLKYEFEYRGQAHIDPELKSVMGVMRGKAIAKAYVDVPAETKVQSSATPAVLASVTQNNVSNSFSQVPAEIYSKPKEITDNARYMGMMQKVVKAISTRNYDSAADCFTDNGLEVYHQLLKYGNARILGTPQYHFFSFGNEIVSRGLQMSFSFKGGVRKSFTEDVVFTFTPDGKISNVSFGLGQTAEDDILGKSIWKETTRMAIMQFLENYKTAYALKRLDYIETIFDDDAVIITGTVASVASSKDFGGVPINNRVVKYNRYDKNSYLRHLKQSFASKEFINIRFANNDVRMLGKGGEVYAIQISQDYYSNNYGDHGYLFLMVDVNDPNAPVIKVRTWQPERDPNFGLYSEADF